MWDIAKFYMDAFFRDWHALNIQEPTKWVRATDHIQEQIDLVKELEEKGYTYRTSDGIYFDSLKFPRYADFARLDVENLRQGSRIDMGEKRAPTDFALWKFSPKDKHRLMEWNSPWGVGFPGWHIECSAMAMKYNGPTLDIHCGGTDHIRVHHTNEIAQSECATGKPFSRFWMHGEFLRLDGAKMSKSSGEFLTVDVLKEKGYNAGLPPVCAHEPLPELSEFQLRIARQRTGSTQELAQENGPADWKGDGNRNGCGEEVARGIQERNRRRFEHAARARHSEQRPQNGAFRRRKGRAGSGFRSGAGAKARRTAQGICEKAGPECRGRLGGNRSACRKAFRSARRKTGRKATASAICSRKKASKSRTVRRERPGAASSFCKVKILTKPRTFRFGAFL